MPLLALILILATLQGLTEYLPVSSSGHLVLGRHFLPGGDQLQADASLEVLMHVGTLVSVLIFYRRRIGRLIAGVFGLGSEVRDQRRIFGLLVLASIPAGIVGFTLAKVFDRVFGNPMPSAAFLLVTGVILWSSRRLPSEGKDLQDLNWKSALCIGLSQAFAILPGISRSGTTIVVGLRLGLSAEAAAAFSFLMSIPAILGAAALKLGKLDLENGMGALEVGTALGTSFLVGLAALGLLVWLTRRRRLYLFAPYCWIVGGAALTALALQ